MTNYNNKNILEREINILNKIHHHNIIKLFCSIETNRQIFIIMEYKKQLFISNILFRKKLVEEEEFYFHSYNKLYWYLHKVKIEHKFKSRKYNNRTKYKKD